LAKLSLTVVVTDSDQYLINAIYTILNLKVQIYHFCVSRNWIHYCYISIWELVCLILLSCTQSVILKCLSFYHGLSCHKSASYIGMMSARIVTWCYQCCIVVFSCHQERIEELH